MATLSRGLRRYTERIIKSPRMVIIAILAVTALLISRAGSLQIDLDPDLWAPQTHPYIQATNELEKVFGGRNVTLIGVVPRHGDIYQPAVLSKIQRMQQAIQELPQAVRHNVLSLGARKVKSINGTSDGMEVRQMMERIPETPEEIAQLKAAVASLPIYVGTLVSRDGQAAAIVADFKMDKARPSYSAIVDQIRPIVDRERDPQVDIYLGGLPVMISWFEFYLMKMPIFFGLALLAVTAIQWWSFRSIQGMLLPTLTAILSVSGPSDSWECSGRTWIR